MSRGFTPEARDRSAQVRRATRDELFLRGAAEGWAKLGSRWAGDGEGPISPTNRDIYTAAGRSRRTFDRTTSVAELRDQLLEYSRQVVDEHLVPEPLRARAGTSTQSQLLFGMAVALLLKATEEDNDPASPLGVERRRGDIGALTWLAFLTIARPGFRVIRPV